MKKTDLPAIVHDAVVVSADAALHILKVRVLHEGNADCSGCAAALLCRRSGTDEIKVYCSEAGNYRPGQQVRIGAAAPTHRRAVGLMLALPCGVTVAAICLAKFAGLSDGMAALSGMAGAAAVYLALYACRRRLHTTLCFKILR